MDHFWFKFYVVSLLTLTWIFTFMTWSANH